MTWWRDPQGRTRALLVGFGVLALIGVLLPAVFNYLLAGDRRQLVVTLERGVTNEDRDLLKRACGGLPGVEVVQDKGRPEMQYRFPVRFRINDSTHAQEAELERCLNGYPHLVLGLKLERDR